MSTPARLSFMLAMTYPVNMPAPYTVIVILGPTASGKSALGVRLAKKFHGVVVSADSRQVYRDLDIGTGKVTKKEMRSVPHFALDVASPRRQYSVSRYVDDVKKVLRRIDPATPIFLVGGSPFYIKAITEPGSFSAVPPNIPLRRRLEKRSSPALVAILKKMNPIKASAIDTKNRRRLVRAIEIASADKKYPSPTLPAMRVLKIGIHVPRAVLHKKIDRRVDQRLRQGMVAEVRGLHRQGLSWKKLDAFGLEYRYISRYLQGQLTKKEMTRQLKSATHEFAKRQMMWWKRDEDIRWVLKSEQAIGLINTFLPLG